MLHALVVYKLYACLYRSRVCVFVQRITLVLYISFLVVFSLYQIAQIQYVHGSILTDEQLQEALLLPALHAQYQCNDMLTCL